MILKISNKYELRSYEDEGRFVALFKKRGKNESSWRSVRYYSSWELAIADTWLTDVFDQNPKDDENFIDNFESHVENMKKFINNYKNEKIREGLLQEESV